MIANLRPLLVNERLRRPTRHAFARLDTHADQVYAVYRCTETGDDRVWGVLKSDDDARTVYPVNAAGESRHYRSWSEVILDVLSAVHELGSNATNQAIAKGAGWKKADSVPRALRALHARGLIVSVERGHRMLTGDGEAKLARRQ